MLTQIRAKTLNGTPVTITTDHGVITGIEPLNTDTPENLPYVAAGLVDLQVNGYAGTDYNTLPLHRDNVRHSYERLYQKGVTSLCPTVITNSDEAISQLMADFAAFCAALSGPRIRVSVPQRRVFIWKVRLFHRSAGRAVRTIKPVCSTVTQKKSAAGTAYLRDCCGY